MDDKFKMAVLNLFSEYVNEWVSPGITGYGDSSYKGGNAKLLWLKFFHQSTTKFPCAGSYIEEFDGLYSKLENKEINELIMFFQKKFSNKITGKMFRRKNQ